MIGFELQYSADDRHAGRKTHAQAAETLACSLLVGRDRRISKIRERRALYKKTAARQVARLGSESIAGSCALTGPAQALRSAARNLAGSHARSIDFPGPGLAGGWHGPGPVRLGPGGESG